MAREQLLQLREQRLNRGLLRGLLAGGIGDRINDALLSFVNDQNAEAEAFFNQADARGIFWST